MGEKVEFGSGSWVKLAEVVLAELVREAAPTLVGERLAVCERYANAPAHLCQAGAEEIVWSFEIDDGAVRVGQTSLAAPDYSTRSDYSAAVTRARTLYSDDPQEAVSRAKARAEAIAAGLTVARGSLDGASPAMRAVLMKLHNRLARQTA